MDKSTDKINKENNDDLLREKAQKIVKARKDNGLEGIVGDLAYCVINTEPNNQVAAVQEFLDYTGYVVAEAFENETVRVIVLKCPESADLWIQTRKRGSNPFKEINCYPKSSHLPNTRLETLVFYCHDLDQLHKGHCKLGNQFATSNIIEKDKYRFLQTPPSRYTGNSIGFIQWRDEQESYKSSGDNEIDISCFVKPDKPWLKNIGTLDHSATRVQSRHRDPAILEFMACTNYNFDFAIYVPQLNSITNVARLPGARFAYVFTSGIALDPDPEALGPTELFVKNYGPRVHHLAFITHQIDQVDNALRTDGLDFLSDLVGSEEEGIRQSFSCPSPTTFLVNEYIERYGGFKGFFTQQNVTLLTLATLKQ